MITRLFPRLRSLFTDHQSLSAFGSAGIRRQSECGAILVVGDWDGQWGVETDEAGMSISRLVVRYFLFINQRMLSNVGEARARFFSDKFSREVEIEGEQTGSDYPSAIATAIAIANDVDDFGGGEGDLFLDEGTVTQERAGARMINIKLSSDPGISA